MALDPRYKAVVFDMDGTFMDTQVDYRRLAEAIFDEITAHGVPGEAVDCSRGSRYELESAVRWLRANGMEDRVEAVAAAVSARATEVEMENVGRARPFDGSLEVLERLRSLDYLTGILTRGGRRYAERVLGMHGILGSFDAVIARDDFPEEESKPSPVSMRHMAAALGVEPAEILYLGDHAFDWMTARDSGAGFYGVLTGGYKAADWEGLGEGVETLGGVGDLLGML